jgi:hypothetical protein
MALHSAPAETAAQLDPEPIMRIASGFMAAKHLFVANELGLFAALADGPLDLDTLASAVATPRRTVRISADAMHALGLLERDAEGRYANTDVVAQFLAGRTPADLRPFLRFWDRLSWPAWSGLESAIRNGGGEPSALDPKDNEVFAAGVEAITAGAAHALSSIPELRCTQRLLDVAGGTGSFLVPALKAHPDLCGTLWELPETAKIARRQLEHVSLASRIEVIAGDALTDPVPNGHDAILIANFVHLLSPASNRALLRRLREAATGATMLLLVDFWTNTDHTQPTIAALLAGEFLLVGGQGDIYSVDELAAWLTEAGWSNPEHRSLAGPQTLVLATAS